MTKSRPFCSRSTRLKQSGRAARGADPVDSYSGSLFRVQLAIPGNVGKRDDASQVMALVGHRDAPYLILAHQPGGGFDVVLGPAGNDIAGHALIDAHRIGAACRRDYVLAIGNHADQLTLALVI